MRGTCLGAVPPGTLSVKARRKKRFPQDELSVLKKQHAAAHAQGEAFLEACRLSKVRPGNERTDHTSYKRGLLFWLEEREGDLKILSLGRSREHRNSQFG